MINNNLLRSVIVRTSICLVLISSDNHDPWDHLQELLLWKSGLFFKMKVLQLGELILIKQWCEIYNMWDCIHIMLATIAMLFGSLMIVMP